MNRLKFIGAFFATAAAAMAQAVKFRPAVVNGECSHCGLMAGPIIPSFGPEVTGATAYIVRCQRCSAAFFQDAGTALLQAKHKFPHLVREWRA